MNAESWHIVEAKRDDGEAAIFRIRELDPRRELTTIFVVEMPYATAEMSKLPGVAAYRRLAQFEEDWIARACATLGWVFVGVRIEDGSFFLYLYGAGDPGEMIAALAPFDGALGFYDDRDPAWGEYQTMRELLDQAKTLPQTATTTPAAAAMSEGARRRRKSPTAAHPVMHEAQGAPAVTMRMQRVTDAAPAAVAASTLAATKRIGKPTAEAAKPHAAAAKPHAAKPHAAAAKPKPHAAKPHAAAAKPKPKAASPKPKAASPKPKAASPKPKAASPKPKPKAASPKPKPKRR